MADVLLLVKAGLKARKAFRTWRNIRRAKKGLQQLKEGDDMDGLKGLIANKGYQFLSAAIRNSLVGAGGYLAGKGWIDAEQAASLVTFAPLVLGVVWSFARKIWPDLKV